MAYTPEQEQEIADLNAYIAEQQKDVESLAALNRLAKNKDFKRIIDNGLFNDEAIRLVLLKADPTQQTPEAQADILRAIDGIGYLRQYFGAITAKGQHALNQVAAAENAITQIGADDEFEDAPNEIYVA